ncbi:hypothetical protein GCM10028791_20930 [Echinicola sediminis]
MDTSLKTERIKWALVFLIGLLVSLVIGEWRDDDKEIKHLTRAKQPIPEDSIKRPDQSIYKLLPPFPQQPKELFRY